MTFKHTKFQDSAVMRSLEKVAREKGLVKNEEMVKTASGPDLAPTPSLIINLLKLSEGLRAKGFEKAAVELENKVVVYKQAQTLYETSKEKGDDLIDAAHPKGSHKLEDVDNDEATFETIIDQHLQSVKMVEKNPTGKLASSDEVMDAVRVALGDSFLGNGRKVAQEAAPAPAPPAESGIGDTAVSVGGSVAASLALTKALGVIKNWRAGGDVKEYNAALQQVQKATTRLNAADAKLMQKAIAENPAVARRLSQAVPDIAKTVEQAAAKQVAQTATKAVVPELGKAGLSAAERAVASEVGKDVAVQGAGAVAKSSGAWSKLVGLLGSAGSTAGAIGATEIGGGTLTGGVAGLAGAGVAGAAALGSAVLIGAVGGYFAGSALFDHYYKAEDLKEAGEKLIGEAEDVKNDFPEYKHVLAFQRTLNQIVAKYPVISKIKSGQPITMESLGEMREINDLILLSNKQSATIWSYAQGHKDDQWFGLLRGFADVVSTAKNYMEVSMKMSDAFDEVARSAYGAVQKKIEEQSKQQVASGGGPDVVALQKSYTDALAKIAEYVQRVKAKQLANAPALLAWLSKAQKAVEAESGKFKAVPDVNRLAVVKDYVQRFEKFKPKVKAFEDKWLV